MNDLFDHPPQRSSFRKWLIFWIGASIALFLINLMTTPLFLWSLYFIWTLSLAMAIYAFVLDLKEMKEKGRYRDWDPEGLDDLEANDHHLERKWRESDFV